MLVIYTIYAGPDDFPGRYVVRRSYPMGTTHDGRLVRLDAHGVVPIDTYACVCDTLAQARESVPIWATCLEASRDDHPCVVESWL